MKISVIIPTYKPQGYIWECLDSLVAQTFPKEDYEVVLVLNGCKEPYKTQIQEYLDAHPSLQVNFIHTDEGGVSNARNIALDVAKGEYVTFIDDDDYVSPAYLEELHIKASPDTISLCYPYAFNDGKADIQLKHGRTKLYREKSVLGKQHFLKSQGFFSGPCMKLIHHKIIQDRRFDKRFKNGEDSLFLFSISNRFKYVDYTSDKAIYYRRIRQNSAVTSVRSKKYIIANCNKMIYNYTKMFFSAPLQYNFIFYTTRVLASIKTILLSFK